METPADSCPEEPSSKKLKPSPTHKTPKYKRRKIALFFAYCGVGYQGMQKNIGAKTIEADLEQALFLSGAIPEQDKDHPKRFDWSRSARTDKGVSAVCQVVSGSFYIDPPGLIDRLHQHLCSQFRVFGFKRVTPSFNAQRFCDRRRYVYLLPVFALDEKCVVAVRSGILSNNDCVEGECDVAVRSGILSNHDSVEGECDVAVRSGILSNNDGVEGECDVAVRSGILSNNDSVEGGCDVAVRSGILSNNDGVEGECDVAVRSGILSNNDNVEGECDVAVRSGILSNNDNVEGECDVAVRSGILSNNDNVEGECDVAVRSGILSNNDNVEGECDVVVRSGILSNNDGVEGGCEGNRVSYGGEVKERFNRILKCYEGTHNFHNFTTRIKAEDPSSQRFIVSFSANEIVIVDGIEFVKCEVVGQSFMLHQIRKLIGFAVLVMRNVVPESLIEIALRKDVNITVPTAPEVGLYLDECFFTSYNKKWKEIHGDLSMKDYQKEAEEFKMKHIYSHIASTEHKERVVGLWLQSLNHENYRELCLVASSKTSSLENSEVQITTEENSSEVEIAADLKSTAGLKTAEVEVLVEDCRPL